MNAENTVLLWSLESTHFYYQIPVLLKRQQFRTKFCEISQTQPTIRNPRTELCRGKLLSCFIFHNRSVLFYFPLRNAIPLPRSFLLPAHFGELPSAGDTSRERFAARTSQANLWRAWKPLLGKSHEEIWTGTQIGNTNLS